MAFFSHSHGVRDVLKPYNDKTLFKEVGFLVSTLIPEKVCILLSNGALKLTFLHSNLLHLCHSRIPHSYTCINIYNMMAENVV